VKKYGTARQATDDNTIQRMRFACWITKATDTHSEYVILIVFPRQQWLRERPSVLRYTYIACLVCSIGVSVSLNKHNMQDYSVVAAEAVISLTSVATCSKVFSRNISTESHLIPLWMFCDQLLTLSATN
jgi:hypothetical protein